MSNQEIKKEKTHSDLNGDCDKCFGLCCIALPYAKSADFAYDKNAGTPCSNLDSNYRCSIHHNLREKGFRGCVGYECFGAGQKVSQVTFKGKDWRSHPELAGEMFDVFPIMQQLHEMLCYLHESIGFAETQPIYDELQAVLKKTEEQTILTAEEIINLDIRGHRRIVNDLLVKTSELVRSNVKKNKKIKHKIGRGSDLIGAKLHGADLKAANLRGALLIAADLRNSDMRKTDVIGADFRDADLRGADLRGSIFLTQAQVNAASGDIHTKLPAHLHIPAHWR